jgi:DNA polymerase-4
LKTADVMIKRIDAELKLPSSGGVSTNRVVAKIAATLAKPHGLIFVPAGTERDFLAPLDVNMIPGVGKKTHENLLKRGIRTIGDLMAHPELGERFLNFTDSEQGHRRHDHSMGSETTFVPLQDPTRMEAILWELVEEVGVRLRKEEFYTRCVTLKIRYSNFQTITRARTLPSPTCFDREIFSVVRDLLRENLAANRAVRLLGVSASQLQQSGWQESLFHREKRQSLENLYRGIDNLREKFGESAVSIAAARKRS